MRFQIEVTFSLVEIAHTLIDGEANTIMKKPICLHLDFGKEAPVDGSMFVFGLEWSLKSKWKFKAFSYAPKVRGQIRYNVFFVEWDIVTGKGVGRVLQNQKTFWD